MLVVETPSLGRFRPVSWTTTQFWGPEAICIVVEPKVSLRLGHQHSQFWPILARFMDYYSPFWGPKAISMVVELQGALRVGHQQSQFGPILARFLDYYSILGSQSHFHD